jgi:thioredoxin reductase
MATGAVMPYIPEDIEGIELAEGYEVHEIDPQRFANKRVAIIGRGNAAFEVANHLAGHAAIIHLFLDNKRVKHAWQTHYPGDLRAINNTVLDMYQLKSLHATLAYKAKKITRRADGTFAVYVTEEQPHWQTPGTLSGTHVYDHVIRCTGWKYIDVSLFAPDVRLAVDAKAKYPLLSTCWESSIPDLFFIGTTMAARERKAASSFIHGFRYSTRTLFHLLEERYHGVPLPVQTLALRSVADLEAVSVVRRYVRCAGVDAGGSAVARGVTGGLRRGAAGGQGGA